MPRPRCFTRRSVMAEMAILLQERDSFFGGCCVGPKSVCQDVGLKRTPSRSYKKRKEKMLGKWYKGKGEDKARFPSRFGSATSAPFHPQKCSKNLCFLFTFQNFIVSFQFHAVLFLSFFSSSLFFWPSPPAQRPPLDVPFRWSQRASIRVGGRCPTIQVSRKKIPLDNARMCEGGVWV